MPKSRVPRRRHRPKPVHPLAGLMVLGRASEEGARIEALNEPLHESRQHAVLLSYLAAVENMMAGRGDAEDLGNLGFMANVSMVLCEQGFGAEYMPDVIQAQDALMRIDARKAHGGSLGFDAPGLAALRQLYRLHEAQCSEVGQGYLVAAGREVVRRLEEGSVLRHAA